MSNKQKLELTWIGKENRPNLEPRILLEDPEKSYHAPHRVTDKDIFDNRLIFGDNLLALKALEQEFAGKIKCVYIDPPFNTQQAFEHYDDGLEHSIWLTLMRDRLEALYKLLAADGTFYVHIDDNELGYLIALVDEIFGRKNRAYIVTFKQSSVSGPKAINPGLVTTASFILVYAKNKTMWSPEKVYVSTKRDNRYSKYIVNIESHFSKWHLIGLRQALASAEGITSRELIKKYPKESFERRLEEFVLSAPERVVRTARVAPKDISEPARVQLKASQDTPNVVFRAERQGSPDMYFLNGEQLIFYSSKTKLVDGCWVTGEACSTIWDDILSNNLHNEGQVTFPNGKKPEALVKRLIEMATREGDWVLDSFAGSGTTGTVAHKMGRRWIMVESGEHCHTHIIPRLRRVILGKDQSGITQAVNWLAGGGFRYFRLAPSLLEKDKWDNWVISKEYNAVMLASAMAKHEGFVYNPDETLYWKQGRSTEKDYIFTTTNFITIEYLDSIYEEMRPDESLLICCKSFQEACADRYENITIKKIPNMLLGRCEFGKDDYSLNTVDLTERELEMDGDEEMPIEKKQQLPKKKKTKKQQGLFDGEDE